MGLPPAEKRAKNALYFGLFLAGERRLCTLSVFEMEISNWGNEVKYFAE